MGVSKDKLKNKGGELSVKLEEWRAEKKLEEDLRSEWAPANGEAEELKAMKSRAELVRRI